MRRNIKDKLHELHVCEGTVQVILGDIFGRDNELERVDGLVDEMLKVKNLMKVFGSFAKSGSCLTQ